MATYDVSDRSAIVTGGASGIGRAIATLLAANGSSVVVADFNAVLVDEVVAEITASGGTATGLVGDVTDPEFAVESVRRADDLAPLRIAINNAGIGGAQALIADYPVDSWSSVLNVNVTGVMYGMRAQLPTIVANGGGSIVNMASVGGTVATPLTSAYIASKHAVIGLTKTGALEYATQGVRVNAVGPGFIHTPMLHDNIDDDAAKHLASTQPIGRFGQASEVAAVTAFLASDAASFVTGAYYPVDGGYLAQ